MPNDSNGYTITSNGDSDLLAISITEIECDVCGNRFRVTSGYSYYTIENWNCCSFPCYHVALHRVQKQILCSGEIPLRKSVPNSTPDPVETEASKDIWDHLKDS